MTGMMSAPWKEHWNAEYGLQHVSQSIFLQKVLVIIIGRRCWWPSNPQPSQLVVQSHTLTWDECAREGDYHWIFGWINVWNIIIIYKCTPPETEDASENPPLLKRNIFVQTFTFGVAYFVFQRVLGTICGIIPIPVAPGKIWCFFFKT